MRLKDLAEKIGAALSGGGEEEISAAASLDEAGSGQITFAVDPGHLRDLDKSRAAAAIVPLDTPDGNIPLLRMNNPRLGFARALACLYAKPYAPAGVSEKAVIGAGTTIGADPSIHPYVVVGENVRIGNRVVLYPGVFIGNGSVIGDDAVIHANVSIGHDVTVGNRVIIHSGTVLGSDGFGFVTDAGRHHKIPQVGGVIIEDDVEIGGNCSIDRATTGNTIIRQGTKLDNLVHVAHNVTIGEHCFIAGQVGIAGSSTIGSYVAFGGQVGVADHTTVGDRVMAGGKAAITRDVEPGQIVAGFYAIPLRDWLKVQAVLPKLPELRKLVSELEQKVKKLEERETK